MQVKAECLILRLTDLPEVRDGVRQGSLGGDVGRHPGVVLNLKGRWGVESKTGQRLRYFRELIFLVQHQIVRRHIDIRLVTG